MSEARTDLMRAGPSVVRSLREVAWVMAQSPVVLVALLGASMVLPALARRVRRSSR